MFLSAATVFTCKSTLQMCSMARYAPLVATKAELFLSKPTKTSMGNDSTIKRQGSTARQRGILVFCNFQTQFENAHTSQVAKNLHFILQFFQLYHDLIRCSRQLSVPSTLNTITCKLLAAEAQKFLIALSAANILHQA